MTGSPRSTTSTHPRWSGRCPSAVSGSCLAQEARSSRSGRNGKELQVLPEPSPRHSHGRGASDGPARADGPRRRRCRSTCARPTSGISRSRTTRSTRWSPRVVASKTPCHRARSKRRRRRLLIRPPGSAAAPPPQARSSARRSPAPRRVIAGASRATSAGTSFDRPAVASWPARAPSGRSSRP
jgi:hypothetical protein